MIFDNFGNKSIMTETWLPYKREDRGPCRPGLESMRSDSTCSCLSSGLGTTVLPVKESLEAKQ